MLVYVLLVTGGCALNWAAYFWSPSVYRYTYYWSGIAQRMVELWLICRIYELVAGRVGWLKASVAAGKVGLVGIILIQYQMIGPARIELVLLYVQTSALLIVFGQALLGRGEFRAGRQWGGILFGLTIYTLIRLQHAYWILSGSMDAVEGAASQTRGQLFAFAPWLIFVSAFSRCRFDRAVEEDSRVRPLYGRQGRLFHRAKRNCEVRMGSARVKCKVYFVGLGMWTTLGRWSLRRRGNAGGGT